MIKTILFDADGVLINAEMFSRQLEKQYGIPAERLNPFFAEKFVDCLVGKADLKEVIEPYMKEWGWQGTVDELTDFWFTVEHKVDEQLIAYIQQLRQQGIACYVATNQEKHRAEYMLNDMGFGESFDGVFASAHLGEKKPSLAFFERILAKLSITDPTEVLFWDDTPASIEAARQVGIQAEQYIGFEDFSVKMKTYMGETNV